MPRAYHATQEDELNAETQRAQRKRRENKTTTKHSFWFSLRLSLRSLRLCVERTATLSQQSRYLAVEPPGQLQAVRGRHPNRRDRVPHAQQHLAAPYMGRAHRQQFRSEEHTSELQSLRHLVCR